MSDEKKTTPAAEENKDAKELDLEALKEVTGGSIRNVKFTKTKDISKDTQSKA